MISDSDEKSQSIWWHTVLHTLGSFILFVPATFVTGLIVMAMDVINEGYIGQTGDGIGFIMRGFQFAMASGASIALPHLLFKRSHVVVVVTIFSTVMGILIGIMFLFQFTKFATNLGFYGWLEFIASGIGLFAGAIYYVVQDD